MNLMSSRPIEEQTRMKKIEHIGVHMRDGDLEVL
jgi:hypothetical protein